MQLYFVFFQSSISKLVKQIPLYDIVCNVINTLRENNSIYNEFCYTFTYKYTFPAKFSGTILQKQTIISPGYFLTPSLSYNQPNDLAAHM